MPARPFPQHASAELFKALADETRLKILHHLFEQERCVADLMQLLGLAQSHVSHHLKALKTVGLVESRRCGQKICYTLHPEVRANLSEAKHETLSLGCCEVTFHR